MWQRLTSHSIVWLAEAPAWNFKHPSCQGTAIASPTAVAVEAAVVLQVQYIKAATASIISQPH